MPAHIEAPIFLVGCPRSGTTLLQQMLDAHPSVAIAPETHFIRLFWLRRDRYLDLAEDENYRRLLADLIALPEFNEMGLNPQHFSERAWQQERTFPNLFHLLLEQFAHKQGVGIVGEKTPNHVLHLTALQQFFPDARFVHIVRDPRAVVNSWRTVPWSTGSIAGDAEMWRYYVSAARYSPASVQSTLLTLHYEQLVLEPEANLRSLCTFLNLEFTPAMLAYYQHYSQRVNVTREPWKANAIHPVSHTSLHRWKTDLSAADIAAIEAVTWFEMRHFHYSTETPSITLPAKATSLAMQRRIQHISRRIRHHIKTWRKS
jgi:Sulfotransferase family